MSVARETKPVEPAGPFDPWDSPYWDLWHYEISDPTEVAELGRLAVEAEIDRRDAPPDPWPTAEEIAEYEAEDDPFARAEAEDAWREAGCPKDWVDYCRPMDREATPAEAEALERWLDQAEASRDFYRRNGSFGDWIAREGGPRP
jgi:hypothetical protein